MHLELFAALLLAGTPYLPVFSSAAEADNAPKIQAFSFSPDLSLGDVAVVTCAVKRGSRGPHTLSWLKDSRGLAEDHRVSASRQSDMLYTLTIRDVGPDDVGNYSCVARNARGEDTFTAPLAVSVDPPTAPSVDISLRVGHRTEKGIFLAVYERGPLPRSEEFIQRRLSAGTLAQAASIVRPTRRRSGEDMSTARPPSLGSCSIFLLLLAVVSVVATTSGPPNVQEFRFPGLLSVGDAVIVSCVVRKGSLGPYKLVWLKNGQVLDAVSRSNVLVSHQGDSISTLTLKDIAVEDNGNYTCVVSNAAGSGEASALLAVTGSPKIQAFTFSPDLSLSDTTLIMCAIKSGSQGPHELSWFKNGLPIRNQERVAITRQSDTLSTLTLQNLRPEDFGNYTCVAANAHGTDQFSTTLIIPGDASVGGVLA
ncbi:hypothetical protein HPB49_017475 [Dermacentor silvarum]|uniref:Uncharacterized protein n=1 Tax=Dermacentor silvarum TaxID=543639 RepID=A0ACB8DQN7_DERSI|nr:hypothetical protein HPB49_017475 [Dermacentor silvarum]